MSLCVIGDVSTVKFSPDTPGPILLCLGSIVINVIEQGFLDISYVDLSLPVRFLCHKNLSSLNMKMISLCQRTQYELSM